MTNVVAIIQARVGSRRLPRKVLAEIAGRPMLSHVIGRVQEVPGVHSIVVATSMDPDDDAVASLAQSHGLSCFRGSRDDVLNRFYGAASETAATHILRVTADCPLLDPAICAAVLRELLSTDADYASNVHPPTYPDGLDVEALTYRALKQAHFGARLVSEREHVTPFIWKNGSRFNLRNIVNSRDLSHLRLTVDELTDLQFVREVVARLPSRDLSLNGVLRVLEDAPELVKLNASIQRNEGYFISLQKDAAL